MTAVTASETEYSESQYETDSAIEPGTEDEIEPSILDSEIESSKDQTNADLNLYESVKKIPKKCVKYKLERQITVIEKV